MASIFGCINDFYFLALKNGVEMKFLLCNGNISLLRRFLASQRLIGHFLFPRFIFIFFV